MEYYVSCVDDEELYHYGVKGMKWGIRRNARVLANSRRNNAVRLTKHDYNLGKITAAEKRAAIDKHNQNKKKYLADINSTLKGTKDIDKLASMRDDISRQTYSSVPHASVKKGLTTANRILEGVHSTNAAVSGIVGAVAYPPLAPVFLTSAAVGIAAERGVHALVQLGLDRFA